MLGALTVKGRSWSHLWESDEYIKHKYKMFELLDNHLEKKPTTILDIGCGFAHESRFFAKKYGSKLWLIEGNKSTQTGADRYGSFGDPSNLEYYHNLSQLEEFLGREGIDGKYTVVNAEDPQLPDMKFDLICSWLSCGFHYPLDTYKDLILKHSGPETKLIFDLRKASYLPEFDDRATSDIHGVNIKKVLFDDIKHIKAEIEFK